MVDIVEIFGVATVRSINGCVLHDDAPSLIGPHFLSFAESPFGLALLLTQKKPVFKLSFKYIFISYFGFIFVLMKLLHFKRSDALLHFVTSTLDVTIGPCVARWNIETQQRLFLKQVYSSPPASTLSSSPSPTHCDFPPQASIYSLPLLLPPPSPLTLILVITICPDQSDSSGSQHSHYGLRGKLLPSHPQL